MMKLRTTFVPWLVGLSLGGAALPTAAGDLLGYSMIAGHFLHQTGPTTLVTDPDFGFSLLASVDLADYDLLSEAKLSVPNGGAVVLDDYGDYWGYLDTLDSWQTFEEVYGWGDYTFEFRTLHEGAFSCPLALPPTTVPPALRLTNFLAVQTVNPARPLTLHWSYQGAANADDFVQAYVTLGHGEIFWTPGFGEPGALDGTSLSATIPAGTLDYGEVYSLNLEITRVVSINADSYPWAEGSAGLFSSTSLDLYTRMLPELSMLPMGTNGVASLEVRAEPNLPVVLQHSTDLIAWANLATNTTPSETSVFTLPRSDQAARFFRAWQP